jgi:hypothetical protein
MSLSTGTCCSGIVGPLMFRIGDSAISPSSAHQSKNRRSDRYRIEAVAALRLASTCARYASMCSRVRWATVVGRPRSARKSARYRTDSV